MLPPESISRLVVILASVVILVGTAVSGVRVGVTRCGGTISIDSQYLLDPLWSITPFRDRIESSSNGSLVFEKRTFSAALTELIVMEAGMNSNSVTVFEIVPVTGTRKEYVPGSSSGIGPCSVTLDPLAGAIEGVVSRGARFTLLNALDASGEECASALTVVLQPHKGAATSVYLTRNKLAYSSSITLVGGSDVTWPMTLTFSSECTIQLILLLDRYGAIDRWFVWIPITVYTGVVAAFSLLLLLLRSRLPVHLAGVYLFLVCLGFFGSCVGLVLELLQWQRAVGRLYPFPDSVTLYCCLCVLYTLLFVPVFCRQASSTILFMGVIRFLIFGLNCSLCVGYWIMGQVLLGSLAVVQFLVTNCILTYYYAYVSVHLQHRVKGALSLPKFSNNFLYLWCVPVTPFACCALMYYDLYLLSHRNLERDAAAVHMQDVVRIYNAQLSLPLLFSQNVFGVALLATACAYYTPLVTLLFVALLLCVVHVIFVIEQYKKEWARWHRQDAYLGFCGHLSLSAVMTALLSPDYEENVSRRASSLSCNVQRAPQPMQCGGDIVAHEAEEILFTPPSWSDTSEVFLPPLPLSHRLGGVSGSTSQELSASKSAAFSTRSRQHIRGGVEYWPSSVER
ncbi:hypothetical protein JKF63_06238 [Porcisia hertigi]|uniref:Uncharacterized protein n=1 Tax=Porcisia hertigi TaxID=2761500 RepID=A0A836IZG1_9TRYP|nr:hypothetical protein JKF63_06238 [Porcisia hertigi]